MAARSSQKQVALVKAGAAPPDRQVDKWVAELRKIVVGGQIEVMSRVGEFLIQNVYGGIEEARSRDPGKAASLRRLSERAEEFGMKPGALKWAVPMALQVRALGRGLSERLGVRHHRALLPVKDAGEKKLLAEAAADAGWTADQLTSKIRRVQKPHAGGRPAGLLLPRFVGKLQRALDGADFTKFRAELSELPAVEAKRLLGRINAAQAALERAEKLLTRGALRGAAGGETP